MRIPTTLAENPLFSKLPIKNDKKGTPRKRIPNGVYDVIFYRTDESGKKRKLKSSKLLESIEERTLRLLGNLNKTQHPDAALVEQKKNNAQKLALEVGSALIGLSAAGGDHCENEGYETKYIFHGQDASGRHRDRFVTPNIFKTAKKKVEAEPSFPKEASADDQKTTDRKEKLPPAASILVNDDPLEIRSTRSELQESVFSNQCQPGKIFIEVIPSPDDNSFTGYTSNITKVKRARQKWTGF